MKYPFLLPRDWSGNYISDFRIPEEGIWKKAYQDYVICPRLLKKEQLDTLPKDSPGRKGIYESPEGDVKIFISFSTGILHYYDSRYNKEIDLGVDLEKFDIQGICPVRSLFPKSKGSELLVIVTEKIPSGITTIWRNYTFRRTKSLWYSGLLSVVSWINRRIIDKILVFPEYTLLDTFDGPKVWISRYGLDFCKEFKSQLKKDGNLKGTRILQWKEKWGKGCCHTTPVSPEALMVIQKYNHLMGGICCVCGRSATYRSSGYILPYCDEHKK